ncbi:MAG: TrbG/VirB9 family P-type conjugative transfer protein [Pseudomonadota bacterium]
MNPALTALAAAVLGLAHTAPAAAQGTDAHIQTVAYDAGSVVRLTGAIGWQIMIEFAEDERIENVSIGDSTAWQITPNKRARMLFARPLSRKASTNMTVITTRRPYLFDLTVGPRQASTPWVVRFAYPAQVVAAIPEPAPRESVALDFAYTRSGHAELLPSRVWDDGRQTYFEFAEETAMPAIFAGGPGKNESLVNVVVRGRVAVVQERALRFTLRSGKRLATVSKQGARLRDE